MKRQLGFCSAVALVAASMIGIGVFTTSGFLLEDLGSPWVVLALWLVGGIVATLGALSYGALARRIPESGGEYLFLARTLHPAAGYVSGWISLLVGFAAPLAVAALGFGEYVKAWLGDFPPQWTGSILIVLMACIHALDVRGGARVQDWAVLVKLFLILGFLCFGFSRLQAPAPSAYVPLSLSTLAVSMLWVSFSYSGWNAVVYVGGEVINPERNLPRALLLGTVLVTFLYLGLNAVFVFSAPASELAGKLEIGRVAALALGGRSLAEAVTALIALALATSVSSMVMAGPRVCARMATDGYLPRWLGAAPGPPRAAISLQAALALAMLWSATYQSLLTYIGFTLGLSTAAAVVGLIRLRLREGSALAVPGWPWVPVVFLVAVLGTTTLSMAGRPVESLLGLGTLFLGWLAWFWQRPRPGRTGGL